MKGSHDRYKYSLLDEGQEAVNKGAAGYFQNVAGKDPFSIEGAQGIYQKNFLAPRLHALESQGGLLDRMNANIGSQGGSLSSRRGVATQQLYGNALADADQSFGGFMTNMFGLGLQEKSLMNSFLGQRNFENVIQQQSSPFDQIMGGIGAVASVAAI